MKKYDACCDMSHSVWMNFTILRHDQPRFFRYFVLDRVVVPVEKNQNLVPGVSIGVIL